MNIMEARSSEDRAGAADLARARYRLPIALLGNASMRIAGGASGVLVGLYLADLANRGAPVDAALVGTLGAMSFGAELIFAVPTGMLSDAIAPPPGSAPTPGSVSGPATPDRNVEIRGFAQGKDIKDVEPPAPSPVAPPR